MQMDAEQMAQEIRNFRRELKVERNLSEHTLKAYECDLHDLLRWGEAQQIFEWNDKTTLSYFTYLQKKKRLSARSIRRKYVSLRQFFRFLEDSYEIHERFFRFSSRKFQIPKTLPKTLERTEIQRLLAMGSCFNRCFTIALIKNVRTTKNTSMTATNVLRMRYT